MALWRKTGGVWQTYKPFLHNGVSFTDEPVVKGFVNDAGVWREFYPTIPGGTTVTVNPLYRNDAIEVDVAWTDPVGAPQTKFEVRIVFINRTTGARSPSAWVTKTAAQFSHTFANDGHGYGSFSVDWNVTAEVIAYSGSASTGYLPGPTSVSSAKQTPQYPAPPAPTSFVVNVQNYDYASAWAHGGGRRLTRFEIQTWLHGHAVTTYNVSAAARSWTSQPWDPNTINARYGMTSQIRAVGPGGVSAWVAISGIIPGPITIENARFLNGNPAFIVRGNSDGMNVWIQRYEDSAQWDQGRFTGNNVWYTASGSGMARDGTLRYRYLVRSETASGWTGRYQASAWMIKMPNPAYFHAENTLSLRNHTTWRTSPDGLSVFQGWYSDHNAAVAWYGGQFDLYAPGRIGYSVTAQSINVSLRRWNGGGLYAAVRVRWCLHNQRSYSGAVPGWAYETVPGKYLARDEGAWVPASTDYWAQWVGGYWVGLAARSGLTEEYMLIWRHIASAGSLDGHPYWTVKVVHDG